jgi:hypothetical protein
MCRTCHDARAFDCHEYCFVKPQQENTRDMADSAGAKREAVTTTLAREVTLRGVLAC